jgi:5'-nucleotidase / UDP-sugar diphosphatase
LGVANNNIPAPGELRLIAGKPNPTGAPDNQMFLLAGDATAGRVLSIIHSSEVTFPPSPAFLKDNDFYLSIYHFNDLHGHLMRFTPDGEEPVFTRMAWQWQDARKKYQNDPFKAVLALSAGDDCIGTVFDELIGDESDNYQVHASYRLYSAAGVDAAVLGNHDFDLGDNMLVYAIQRDADFPILAANISGCEVLDGLRYPASILVVKGVRIGIIGLVTPAEIKINSAQGKVVDPIEVVHNILPALRPLCDVVIILSHLGYSLASNTAPMLLAGDVELAQSLPHASVHLIVGGHSHHELNQQGLSAQNIVNGIPIVQAGALGRYLGRVDIRLQGGTAAVTHARLLPTSSLPVDARLEREEMLPLISQVRKLFSRSIGEVENDPDLTTDAVRNTFASGELALANFITDAMVHQLNKSGQQVDFAMIDSSCLRRGLEAGGRVTFGDWFNLMPFADTIRMYRLTGQELHDLLQDNVYRIDRPGEPNTERGFLQFSRQVRYSVCLGKSRSEASAEKIIINGIPLEEQLEHTFIVAGTSFLRELASNWERQEGYRLGCSLINLHSIPYSETDLFLRRELVFYILEKGGVTRQAGASLDGRLKFIKEKPLQITSLPILDFIAEVSGQKHAMAGAVIALSAAQAVALGQACVQISMPDNDPSAGHSTSLQLGEIQARLLQLANQDAVAISEFVALRDSGQELRGQQLLCELPTDMGRLSIQAAKLLQDFRPHVNERVRDDLEIAIGLLAGAAQAALLLLDSNLRIWPSTALLDLFEPAISELVSGIENLEPSKRIR